MKRRVLSFGVPATHSSITPLAGFGDSVSISDYDAFILDPHALGAQQWPRALFERRQRELRDLVSIKDGVVICFLRADRQIVAVQLGGMSCYALLDQTLSQPVSLIRNTVREGEGSQWRLVSNAKGAMGGYFRVLQNNVRFEAFLETQANAVETMNGIVFAKNSVGYPVAVEFVAGTGRLCFIPPPHGVPGDRVGAAIARIVDAHFGGPAEIEIPAWAIDVTVPGAGANDGRIAELEKKMEEIKAEVSTLEEQRADLTNYRRLLYGYGKTVLEPVVRQALRLLGFEVPEPEQYTGEWDVELKDPINKTAIGEVEGSDGPIDVEKFRQLLNYFQSEVLEGRIHKAILIGNGHRSKELEAAERRTQFTEHVLRGAKQFGFCLLPTADLFKAVCSVLESSQDEALKAEIRKSILSTDGVWAFAREPSQARAQQG